MYPTVSIKEAMFDFKFPPFAPSYYGKKYYPDVFKCFIATVSSPEKRV